MIVEDSARRNAEYLGLLGINVIRGDHAMAKVAVIGDRRRGLRQQVRDHARHLAAQSCDVDIRHMGSHIEGIKKPTLLLSIGRHLWGI